MKTFRKIAVVGAVATGLAFSAGLALAVTPPQHTLNVPLPNGGTAVIHYSGDVAPQVTFDNVPAPNSIAASGAGGFLSEDPAFAELQRLSASMEQRINSEMAQMSAPGAQMKVGGLDTPNLPAGSRYTMVSNTSDTANSCMRSVEITQVPGDKAPKVVSKTSGNCKAFEAAAPSTPGAKASSL